MKMTSIFKKASVIAIAITLILLTVVSILPAALAEDSSTSEQSTTDHGEKLSASNVSLSGSITMMFYFTGLDEWKDSDYIQITVPKEDGSTVTTEKFKNQLSYDETKNRWLVEVPVAYAQQNDVVKMQWFKDGVGGKIRTKTVRNYYDKVVEQANKGSQTHANLVAPLKSMLNCGAMAQTMFEHNDSNLANDGLYASGSNPVNDMTVEHFYDVTTRKDYTEDNNGTDVEFLGGTAFLQNTVSMRIYFDCPDEVLTAKIYKGDMSKNDTRTIKIKVDEDGRKFVTITNIIPTEFDVRFTVLVNGAKFEYSVLDYALDTLEYYLATDAQKNTARALYLFYTNMKDYTDASYTPGPKEKDQNGNIVTDESGKPVVIECSCERSHFEGESIICSDCGKTLSATATTKITVTAVTTGTIQAGTPANIVVTYAITNAADLEALSLTSKFDDVTVGLKYVDKSVVNGKEGYQCTVDKNVVIEATAGTFSNNTVLATVTYTVTANVPGIYKLSTVIREAANAGGSVDVSNFITNTPSIEVKSAGCETHKLEYVNKGDTHTVHCPECEQIIKYSEEHSYTEHYSDNGNIRTYTNECICGCNSYEYTIKLATDADGNVIAPNVIITAADLAQMRDPVRMGGADLAADGSYVTFKNDTTATLDGYFMAVKDGDITEPSGQYMMIKYRTTYNKGWEVFIGANNGKTTASGSIDNFTISAQTNGFNGGVIADGEWHVVIIDLATINTNGIKPEDDGTYLVDYMRFDIFNTASTDAQTVDVAYIAFADSKEKLTGVDDMNDYVYSDKYSGGTVGYPMNAITDNPYFDPTIIAKKGASYSGTVIKDTVNNNMPFARLTIGSSTPYFNLWSSASNKIVDSGSYIGILYRENGRTANDWFKFFINSTSDGAVGGFSATLEPAYCGGEWRFGLIDLSAVIEAAGTNADTYYDPATGIASLRFDLGNNNKNLDVTVDVAFVALFDSEEQAYEYMGSYATNYLNVEGGQGCKHDATAKSEKDCCTYCRYCGAKTAEAVHTADTKWSPVVENDGNADGKLYEAKLCTVCGGQVDVREAQVRYSLNSKTSETSAYKVFVKGWAAVNGGVDRYVYRVIDEDGNVSAWKPVTEGSPIANLTDEDTAYIDAIEGSQLGLADYYANVFFTGGIYAYIDEYAGQSVKVEFGAVPKNNPGTEDAPNVISIYTSTTAITAINNTNFRAQFQGIKVGTTSLTSSSVANVVNHFDLSATPLTSANSINFYGWFIAESGTKNYKICVIDEDGKQTYVEFPAGDGMLDNSGLESIARGADLDLNTSGDANCRKGAKFDCSAGIDLSDYAGQTVTVEFYAETNNGKTILIADFTNVQVACDHAKNTNSNYVTLTNDPQHEHLICSICEEKIDTRFVSTVKEGLTFFNPSTLNSCVINHVTASSGAENGLDYFRVTLTRNGEGYIFLTNGPVLTGVSNYVAMMVRRPQAATYSVEIFVTPAGTEEISNFTSNSQNLIQSSDWQLVIFDANVLSSVINKETGIGCTRLDIFNTNTAAIDDIADIAWVGFFDSAADAYALFNAYSISYNNASNCTHETTAKSAYDCCTYCVACGEKTAEADHTADTKWSPVVENDGNADGKLYEAKLCTVCGGQAEVREAVARTSFNGATDTASAYKFFIKGWAIVNGGVERYVYRVIDEEGNVSAWKTVTVPAGSPLESLTDSDTAYIGIIEKEQPGFADYYANVKFFGGIYAYIDEYAGQSVKVEFGAVPKNNPGLEDAPNVISIYTSSTAITAINNTNFRAQFQGLKVNGNSLTSSSVANVVNHFDLSATPLTSANSINFYGWFIAESGTKNYKICVIDEDGKRTYVEFPADDGMLDNSGLESIAGDVALDLNTSGDANCRKGAKFDCSAGIDLSDYAGQTVTVEFYAETNNGKTILIADFTNVKVPKAIYTGAYRTHFNSLTVNGSSLQFTNDYNKMHEFDLLSTPLTSATSIKFSGWFIADSGTKNYMIRVTDENGTVTEIEREATEDYKTDAVKSMAATIGLSTEEGNDCRTGAWMYPADIDLSNYADQTVTVEFYSVTNKGALALIVRFTNVKVPAAQ